MRFAVHEMPRAKSDKRSVVQWLSDQSPQGAAAWLDAYDEMIDRLSNHATSYGMALENDDCEMDIQQVLFKTRRGSES